MRYQSLTIDYSVANDQIFAKFNLLVSFYRGESESGINFVVFALVKKFFNTQNFNKIKL